MQSSVTIYDLNVTVTRAVASSVRPPTVHRAPRRALGSRAVRAIEGGAARAQTLQLPVHGLWSLDRSLRSKGFGVLFPDL